MRDAGERPEYWTDKINKQAARIDRFQSIFANPTEPEKKRRNAQSALIDMTFELALAQYSAGLPMAQVAETALRVVCEDYPSFVEQNPPGSAFPAVRPGYSDVHRYISVLVLCRATPEQNGRFFAALDLFDLAEDGYGGYDAIWSFYRDRLGHPLSRPVNEGVHWPSAFEPLWDALHPDEPGYSRFVHLKVFLADWYDQMAPQFAAQTDRLGPDVTPGSYVGYWCLEAGAAAVVHNIEDQGLRDSSYYPHDWVAWARAQQGARARG